MVHFGAITLFPGIFDALDYGVTGRAFERGLATRRCWNPRDFVTDRHRTVDGRPYGGGPGMVMSAAPLKAALDAARDAMPGVPVVYLSPQGERFTQTRASEFAERPGLILLCGRYEGIDERLIEAEVDDEWSIGDYVLSGGEFAALAVIDAIARLLPGALGDERSAIEESFTTGLLDCPHFTRPEDYKGHRVPAVLLSGDHGEIRRWRLKQALGRTWRRRPDLLEGQDLSEEMRQLLAEYIAER
ncbi:MAG: tRNA (guanosine(37)-N1)-methyltransferase TrmD [Pseudomonadota bacterium]